MKKFKKNHSETGKERRNAHSLAPASNNAVLTSSITNVEQRRRRKVDGDFYTSALRNLSGRGSFETCLEIHKERRLRRDATQHHHPSTFKSTHWPQL